MLRLIDRRSRLAALATMTVLVLDTGCGGEAQPDAGTSPAPVTDPSGQPEAGANAAPNATDIAFAGDMIPHHQQAIEMSDLAADRAGGAEVKELAGRIRQAQDPEITQMSTWLREWGQPVPSAGPGGGHDAHHGMPGMMSADEMADLMAASGADFDRMFLEMMIRHHEGAIEMAEVVRRDGVHQGVRELANSVATSQSAEITEMRDMLGAG